jgi:hypothetical protein
MDFGMTSSHPLALLSNEKLARTLCIMKALIPMPYPSPLADLDVGGRPISGG